MCWSGLKISMTAGLTIQTGIMSLKTSENKWTAGFTIICPISKEENTPPKQYAEHIAEHVKRDVIRAVEHFLEHIPSEMKGDEQA